VASLVVGDDGTAGPTGPLPAGTYTVHESVVPPGYEPAADQVVTVTGGQNTVAAFTGAAGDAIERASLDITKVDATTGAPLAGAVLDVAYDATDTGTYDVDLGTCTTDGTGMCTPLGDLLPGNYRVTEVTPPPGHVLDPDSPVFLTLAPGQTGSVVLRDPALVGQAFVKTGTGNVPASGTILSGATLLVDDQNGSPITSCTTDDAGRCSVPVVLVEGRRYCWHETAAPVGLEAGAHGCFQASVDGAPIPIVVDDPGDYVQVLARKVDAADPTRGVPGATFDLYRMDDGDGPTHPTPAAGAAALPGGTWVARATSADGGIATFPLELPSYRYCIIEHAAPPGYAVTSTPACSDVLVGVDTAPPTTVTVVVADTPTTLVLHIAKTNALEPDTGVPGATYDLYAEDPAPAGAPSPPPAAPVRRGMTWFAVGTTDASGHLAFTIPSGHRWCVAERTSPPGFLLDTGLHCTAELTVDSPDPVTHLAVAEQPDEIVLSAFKFDASAPGIGIPGASYALFVTGAFPIGFSPPTPPPGLDVPVGHELYAIATTDASGALRFHVPVGHAWCLRELSAPPGYELDQGLHCTAVLDASTPATARHLGLAELAFTGATLSSSATLGGSLLLVGIALVLIGRRSARRRRGGMIKP
jgi:hypothetical protein